MFRDFAHFYVLGAIANLHDAAALYSVERQTALLHELVPVVLDTYFPPAYGPQVALLFAPLARLPYLHALYVWLFLTAAIYVAAGYALWRVSPRLRDRRWAVGILLIASPAIHYLLMYGHITILALAAFVSAYLALRSGREYLAGAFIGLLAYKPQLGLAAAVLFVCAGQWRVVIGATLVALAQLASGALFWGPGILPQYAQALLQIPGTLAVIESKTQHLHGWRQAFQLMAFPPGVVTGATVVASLVTLGAAVYLWRTDRRPEGRFALLLLATMLVNPHFYVYDLVILTPVFFLVWPSKGEGGAARAVRWGLLVLLYAAPALEFLAPVLRVQASVVAASGLMLAMFWELPENLPPQEK